MILKDAYNFYSSKLFLHPYNSKVLQRLDASGRVSRHQVTAEWGLAFRTWRKSLAVFKSLLHTQASVCRARWHAPVLRVAFRLVTAWSGMISFGHCAEWGDLQGAGPFPGTSHHACMFEKSGVKLFTVRRRKWWRIILPHVCVSLSPGLVCVQPMAQPNGSLTRHCSFRGCCIFLELLGKYSIVH